jgi:hypothetical protein
VTSHLNPGLYNPTAVEHDLASQRVTAMSE